MALKAVVENLDDLDESLRSEYREVIDPKTKAKVYALDIEGGIGNLFGYLGAGAWFAAMSRGGEPRWTLFWSGLAAVAAVVLVFFLAMYRGRSTGLLRREGETAPV